MWESARNLGRFSLGVLWAPPNTNPILYVEHGDQPSFTEYHWHGLWLLTGNAYIIAGMAIFAAMTACAIRGSRRPGTSASPGASGGEAGVGQSLGEQDAPADAQFPEDAAQVVIDGARAEEQPGGDVPVGGPAGG
jgi:hypothetical protein